VHNEGASSRLSPQQYAVLVLYLLDGEVGNGGLWQLYYNSPGFWANEFSTLLRRVGAPAHANVLERANALVAPGIVPVDVRERRALVGELPDDRFEALEAEYWELEDLDEIVGRYIRSHPDAFFSPAAP
jgi:hypothetical protein